MDFVMSGDASVTDLTLHVFLQKTDPPAIPVTPAEAATDESSFWDAWSTTVDGQPLEDLATDALLEAKKAVDSNGLKLAGYEKIKSALKYLIEDTDLLEGEMLEDVNNTMPDSTIEGHWTHDGVWLELSGHWELEYCHYSG